MTTSNPQMAKDMAAVNAAYPCHSVQRSQDGFQILDSDGSGIASGSGREEAYARAAYMARLRMRRWMSGSSNEPDALTLQSFAGWLAVSACGVLVLWLISISASLLIPFCDAEWAALYIKFCHRNPAAFWFLVLMASVVASALLHTWAEE